MSHLKSSGRGGAGNIVDSAKSPQIKPKDLETPTLKESVVTTGRGGSGNMAKNTDPTETRALQDVEPVTRRESSGITHFGRGGTGNVVDKDVARDAEAKLEREEGAAVNAETAREQHDQKQQEQRHSAEQQAHGQQQQQQQHSHQHQPNLVEKGKQFLFGKK